MKIEDIVVVLAVAGVVYMTFSGNAKAATKPRTVYAGLESAWGEIPGQGGGMVRV